MIKATATTNTKPFDNIRKRAGSSPTLMKNAVKIAVRRERVELMKRLTRAIRLPKHPFIWSYDPAKQLRARRWWFRAVKAGLVPTANGRYARTGLLIKSWKLISDFKTEGGAITLTNNRPRSEWVVGAKQVPSHKAHPQIDKEALLSGKRLSKDVEALWHVISDPNIALSSASK